MLFRFVFVMAAAVPAVVLGCSTVPDLHFVDDPDATDATTPIDASVPADPSDASAADGNGEELGGTTCDGADAGVYCCGAIPCVGDCATRCSYCPSCTAGDLCCIWVTGAKTHSSCVQTAADCKGVN